FARAFAAERGLRLVEVDLQDHYGFDVPGGARAAGRVPCSACGLSKRHVFDEAARRGGYDALVTGHNLDDEAAVLFGNVLRWQTDYLGRQQPVLPARDGFPKKVKPLVRLGERETAAYCVVRGIDYLVEECPMAAGNRHLGYKEALDAIEATSPGTKHDFYFGFLSRAADHFVPEAEEDRAELVACAVCGAPTPTEVCAFCRLVERAGGTPRVADRSAGGPQPVTLGRRPS
ncbi:MAG TPA: tRNA(Ile)-lysidine synthetase, partial [Acidimicrobiales bacterium]|nr:tRNA(Ile)-lysidine synthetase [Acidimicrobiales bacterium]